jgi:hypothetical protein
MPRSRTRCGRHGCGLVAGYLAPKTGQILCPDHAADLAAILVLRQIDPTDWALRHIRHGTPEGYRLEQGVGVETCAECRLAWKKHKIELDRAKVAA